MMLQVGPAKPTTRSFKPLAETCDLAVNRPASYSVRPGLISQLEGRLTD